MNWTDSKKCIAITVKQFFYANSIYFIFNTLRIWIMIPLNTCNFLKLHGWKLEPIEINSHGLSILKLLRHSITIWLITVYSRIAVYSITTVYSRTTVYSYRGRLPTIGVVAPSETLYCIYDLSIYGSNFRNNLWGIIFCRGKRKCKRKLVEFVKMKLCRSSATWL